MIKLRTKIFFLTATIVGLVSVGIGTISVNILKTQLERELHLRSLNLARTLAMAGASALAQKQSSLIESLMGALASEPDLEEAVIFDKNKTPLFVHRDLSDSIDVQPNQALFDKALQSFLPQIQTMEKDGRRSKVMYQRIWTDEIPSTQGSQIPIIQTLGVAAIQYSFFRIDQQIREEVQWVVGLSLLSCGVAFLLALILSRRMTRSLEALQKSMPAIAEGNFSTPLPKPTQDEVGQLITSFKNMIEKLKNRDIRIQTLNTDLEKKVIDRTNAYQELESFSYSVSHDLRAPLRHMSGFVELLKKHAKASLDEKATLYIEKVYVASKRMGVLIDDLLAFSRAGRTELNKSPVSMKALVKEVQAECIEGEKDQNIEWVMADLPDVVADPPMIRQVLMNLISNAVKYSSREKNRRIEVGYEDQDNNTHLFFVKDNGVGFDMKHVDKLFGVFRRLHTREEFEGTGIGLANVRRIIQRHHGKTWAKGDVNKGATFYFTLPKNNPEVQEEPMRKAA